VREPDDEAIEHAELAELMKRGWREAAQKPLVTRIVPVLRPETPDD
jgi:hypothetical protein